ncbi:MAG: glycosyltransferase [Saprospiraceae bacterium]|nr:glycosyltransferase [Candidatus Brachybacter algidus]
MWPFMQDPMGFVNKEVRGSIKFSIVTISFNQASFLEGAIRSILMQNYPNMEYIIIDGGSTDHSVKIIKKYETFLKYWISEKDLGPANALNKGLRFCDGEYFYYLNSDDILEPGIFHFINNYIQSNPGYDFYYGHGSMTYDQLSDKFPIYSTNWDLKNYVNSLCSIIQQSTFIKLEKIKRRWRI